MNYFLPKLVIGLFIGINVYARENASLDNKITFPGTGSPISFDVSSDGKYLAAIGPKDKFSSRRMLIAFELKSQKEQCRVDLPFTAVKFAPDGTKFVGTIYSDYDYYKPLEVVLFDTKTCEMISSIGYFPDFSNIQFSNDGAKLLFHSRNTVQLYNTNSSKLKTSFNGFSGQISPDGNKVAVENYNEAHHGLEIFDEEGNLIAQINSNELNFYKFTKDSLSIVYSQREKDDKLKVYSFDLKTGTAKLLLSNEGKYNYATPSKITNSARTFLFSNYNAGAYVFDLVNGSNYQTATQPGFLGDFSFNHDETMFVARVDYFAIPRSKRAVVENISTQKRIATIQENSSIDQISFNPAANQIIYSIGDEGVLKFLDL